MSAKKEYPHVHIFKEVERIAKKCIIPGCHEYKYKIFVCWCGVVKKD